MKTSKLIKDIKEREYAFNAGQISNSLIYNNWNAPISKGIPAFHAENWLTGYFIYSLVTVGEKEGITTADDLIQAYVNRNWTAPIQHADFTTCGTLVGCYLAATQLEHIKPVCAIIERGTGRLVAVFDSGRGRSLTTAEVISGGMQSVNGIAPQQTSAGHWVNPKGYALDNGFIGIDAIKINNFQKPTNN